MKLALLGYTPQALVLAKDAVRLGHEVVAACDAGSHRSELREGLPATRLRDGWESLLAGKDIDAVIVAGPRLPEDEPSDVRERRDDQLRKLIQAEVPLLIIPPVCEAIVGFELEMIRKDVRGIIVPALAGPLHPVWNELDPWLSGKGGAASLGPIEVVNFERFLPLRQRQDVLSAFVYDAELLRRMVGPLQRITAAGGTRTGEEKPSLANLAVHVEGSAEFPGRWSALPAENQLAARITLQGANDRVVLSIPAAGSWRLRGPALDREYPPFDSAAAVLAELENAIAFRSIAAVTWLDACRAVEAMEAIDRSLARGRAIDLYNEEHTEESSFKGIMAAGGCLLLLTTLTALGCAGVLPVLIRPEKGSGDAYWGWLQVCIMVPLAVFLAAQLLSLGLAAHRKRKKSEQESTAKPDV
jgi:hypothetical protein